LFWCNGSLLVFLGQSSHFTSVQRWHLRCVDHAQELSIAMENTGENIQLLTLDEAATLLQVSKRTLQRMIKVRELPAFKVGGQWRLRETQLRQWVEHREIAGGDSEKGRTGV
jgi:excisionase family DNA binding protein